MTELTEKRYGLKKKNQSTISLEKLMLASSYELEPKTN